MSKKFRNQPAHSRLLVLFLLFAFVLAACGGGEPTQAPASEAEAAEQPTATEAAAQATEPAAEATEAPTATEPPSGDLPGTGAPSFSADIQPIFNASCSGCHDSRASGGVQLNSYESLMASNVITAGDAAASILWSEVESGSMPKAGGKLSAEQIQLIADWINAGANND